jgi:large subunit ribosomal protein L14
MLRLESTAKVADNSGALEVQVIGHYGGSKKKIFYMAEVVKVTVKRAKTEGSVKKGQLYRAVIVRLRKETRREDGTYISFDDNAVVLLNGTTNDPLGTRIFGPVARELKTYGFDKITYLAPETL